MERFTVISKKNNVFFLIQISKTMKKAFTVIIACCIFSGATHAQTKSGSNNSQSKFQERTNITSVVKATNSETVNQSVKPVNNNVPKYVNTGNSTQDNENYRIAKEKWIKENPEKYASVANKNSLSKQVISKKDFDKMPKVRQDYLLSHPEKFEIK